MESSTTAAPRRGPDRSQREQELVAAAQHAFVKLGYHGASMDTIAGLAGVSKPILYQVFPGKLELYQSLVQQRSDELLGAVASAIDSCQSSRERLTRGLAAFFDYVDKHEESFLLLADSGARNGPPLAAGQAAVVPAFTDLVAPAISDKAGSSVEEGRLIARALGSGCISMAVEWLAGGKITPRAELAADVADVLWGGMQRRLPTS